MKNTDKLTFLDIAGMICFFFAIVMGFIWTQFFPVSFLILLGWLFLLISFIKSEKAKK